MTNLIACWLAVAAVATGFENLFEDPELERGFVLSAATIVDRPIEIGVLPPVEGSGAAQWRIAQWGTRHLLTPGPWEVTANGHRVENAAKSVVLSRNEDGERRIRLAVSGAAEYGDKLRSHGESWPHLLIEQRFEPTIPVVGEGNLFFGLRFRVVHCDAQAPAGAALDESLHTAQVTAFWTLHNVDEGGADYGEMIWFGIPLFDARYPAPRGHQALDAGQEHASGRFIYVPDGERFFSLAPTGDGIWRQLDFELEFLVFEALAAAKARGLLEKTEMADWALGSFNLGWELTGPYEAAIEFEGLRFGRRAAHDVSEGNP